MTRPVKIIEGNFTFRRGTTYYRIVGPHQECPVPLVTIHGGPGMTWDYLEDFDALASTNRAVVYFDQTGNGKSHPLGVEVGDIIHLEYLVDQLEHLLTGLEISNSYALLAHSAGTAIALEHALRRPAGLRALVIANGFASTRLMMDGIWKARERLPRDVEGALSRHEAAGTTHLPEYTAAVHDFMSKNVCRVPASDGLRRTLLALSKNPHVYGKLWGPTMFDASGSYSNWSAVGRLEDIEIPTLVYRGEFDEADEKCVAPFGDMPNVQFEVLDGASHMPHLETREACIALVSSFLAGACPR